MGKGISLSRIRSKMGESSTTLRQIPAWTTRISIVLSMDWTFFLSFKVEVWCFLIVTRANCQAPPSNPPQPWFTALETCTIRTCQSCPIVSNHSCNINLILIFKCIHVRDLWWSSSACWQAVKVKAMNNMALVARPTNFKAIAQEMEKKPAVMLDATYH